ncbi:50S ribosomal protein L9 [Thermoflavifilum thermophilum]|uniref:Large ribosomal subunit protein bL9 n=1 Tax=Thermoflavifilum thermophilum TaxID=1393122 RepID=A0A1I7N4Q7_9BACT|nr:50S ribosomal protein L9 [Thermoflavifilum thermophilum]SFV29649.1 large subunit ribosomal protein L9 [Thermoflavifilum thermophilum]
MQVILLQDVENLGHQNDLVTVKDGYGRNYLIPRKLAVEANPSNLKQLEQRKKAERRKEEALLATIAQVKEALQASPLRIGAKVGTSGKIFGSVTPVQIAQAIKSQKGYEIDRRRIHLLEEVKELGVYTARIDFGKGNEVDVQFEVVAE